MTLIADLRLRFGTLRLPTRVYLPSPSSVPAGGAPLVLWLAGRNTGEVLSRELSAVAAAVVLELGRTDDASVRRSELSALDWAAEHAREFGADSRHLVVAGHLAGAVRAARLAVDARDDGWPVLHKQVLIRPAFTDLRLTPSDVTGTATAAIVTTGARGDAGSRYATTLRDAGVEVQELVSDVQRPLPVHELARAIR